MKNQSFIPGLFITCTLLVQFGPSADCQKTTDKLLASHNDAYQMQPITMNSGSEYLNHPIHLQAGLGGGFPELFMFDCSFQYGIKPNFFIAASYNGTMREPQERPDDYFNHSIIIGPFEDPEYANIFSILAGTQKYSPSRKSAASIAAGPAFGNCTLINYVRRQPPYQYSNYSTEEVKHTVFGLAVKGSARWLFSKYVGLEIGASGHLNKHYSYLGFELGLNIGVLR